MNARGLTMPSRGVARALQKIELNLTNITQLCDIDPMIDDLKVLGRCISLWKCHPAGRPTKVYAMDMVFQDAQGNRVQATVRNKNISKFQLLIDEGSCYRIGGARGDALTHKPLLTRLHCCNSETRQADISTCGSYDPKQKVNISVTQTVKREMTKPQNFSKVQSKKWLARSVKLQKDIIAFCTREFTKYTENMDGRISPWISTRTQQCTYDTTKQCKPALFTYVFSTISFILGAITSVISGFLGMKIATYANARTTLEARKRVRKAFIVAFRSRAMMGILLAANGLLVLYITINLFKIYYGDDWEGLFEAIPAY
ncbi:pyrophosphate-energized vacuolar membrane proton pump [Tanacetum coccineum]